MLTLTDNFQDQMKRELSYREEMVQQLQIVRGAYIQHALFWQNEVKGRIMKKVTLAYFF